MEQKESAQSTKGLPELRQRAQRAILQDTENTSNLSAEETAQLLHELRVHQIELEMQNDELRKTQSALQQSRDDYLDLYDFAPVGYLSISEKGMIIKANLTLAKKLGIERSFLINQPFSQFICACSHDRYYSFLNRLLKNEHSPPVELQLNNRSGSDFDMLLESIRIEETHSSSIEFRITLSDITAHKKAEEELKESEEKFRMLFEMESTLLGLVEKETGIVLEVNQSFLNHYGYAKGEVLKMKLTDFSVEPEKKQHVSQDQESKIHLKWHKKKDGTVFPMEMFSKPLNLKGKDVNIIAIHDITERMIAEDKLKASLKEKEILFHEIDHRVKNNMSVILGLLHLQMNSTDDEKIKEALLVSKNRVQTMSLIHMALYQSDDFTTIHIPTYLSKLGMNIIQGYNISEKIRLKTDICNVNIGVKQAAPIGLIVNELISNALKYAFPEDRSGEIVLIFQLNNDKKAKLVVSDNGIGIPESFDLKKADSLGLKIVKMIAESQLGGSMDMESNKGTKFIIQFNIGT